MKYFEPHNRHLWVDLLEDEKEEKETAVLLPENYKPKESEFAVVKLKDCAPDCNHRWVRGKNLVVERRMVREINLGDNSFHAILENYVLGVIK